MTDDYEQTREALEAAFWKRSGELDAIAKEQRAHVLAQRDLSEATGMLDLHQLDDLMSVGLTPDTVDALVVVPLVAVAWASGAVEPREREVALAAAVAVGIPSDSHAFATFASWLDHPPDLNLLEIWGSYARALRSRLLGDTYGELRGKLLDRARRIAEAAGGPGNHGEISPEEAAMLDRIAALT